MREDPGRQTASWGRRSPFPPATRQPLRACQRCPRYGSPKMRSSVAACSSHVASRRRRQRSPEGRPCLRLKTPMCTNAPSRLRPARWPATRTAPERSAEWSPHDRWLFDLMPRPHHVPAPPAIHGTSGTVGHVPRCPLARPALARPAITLESCCRLGQPGIAIPSVYGWLIASTHSFACS